MKRTDRYAPAGFTLLELMLVIAVIGILMSMMGAAAYSARQRAYATTAAAEVQQIAAAFKAYYIAHHEWPNQWGPGKVAELDKKNLDALIGGKSGDGVVYLDISDFRFEDDKFVDPWGNAYEVGIDTFQKPEASDAFECAVSFPNHMRHYYEEGVFSSPQDEWDWGGSGEDDQYQK